MKPAINVGLSVSRVGSSAQIRAMKQVAGTMKLDLAQFRDLQAFAQFSSDLDEKTKSQLDRGLRVNEVLKQGWDKPLKVEEQVAIIFAAVNGHLDKIKLESVVLWEAAFLDYLRSSETKVLTKIAEKKQLDDEVTAAFKQIIEAFNALHPEFQLETI